MKAEYLEDSHTWWSLADVIFRVLSGGDYPA